MQVGGLSKTETNIRDVVKPVVMDVSSGNLLKRCLHGHKKEESFGLKSIESRLVSTLIHFTILMKFFKKLKIEPRKNLLLYTKWQ